jgi:NACHT domain
VRPLDSYRIVDHWSDKRNIALGAITSESPFLGGWRFSDRMRCLQGTRKEFLNHISQWIQNPESERGLVLLGQAGTGKSSIAHEIAHLFDKKCLASYIAFLRAENSKDVVCGLFTKLAHDLSVRYSPFKLALKRAMMGCSSLRGTRDYPRLFERIILEPLRNLQLDDIILIIIDGLDESGLTIGKNGLHSFLAERLIELPSNFRVLITSRPVSVIETAFANAESIRTIYMDDAYLAANTRQDIGLYLQKVLPKDLFKNHGGKLKEASEGLFQWAAVACSFITGTGSLGLSDNECVQRLLGHSRGLSGQGLLDNLYEEVLKEYFKTEESQVQFRSVMGHLFAAMEPLSVDSLVSLRRYAPTAHPENSGRVLKILNHLGSLLSKVKVTSSDPIVPLHTSFRDFLTSQTSNVFYVDLAGAHYQLAHSCLGVMLDKLKFNICKLESSYLANCDVPDLQIRVDKYIPPALSYGCIYWGDHLERVAFDHDVLKKLRSLVETKFLFWLEVLSVKSRVGVASRALSSLLIWLWGKVCSPHNST